MILDVFCLSCNKDKLLVLVDVERCKAGKGKGERDEVKGKGNGNEPSDKKSESPSKKRKGCLSSFLELLYLHDLSVGMDRRVVTTVVTDMWLSCKGVILDTKYDLYLQ